MDFGTNSLWGSFSADQAQSRENNRTEENESDTETSNTNALANQPKWDINEFLGVHGEACSSGHGCSCTECDMEFAFPGLLEAHKSKMHGITPLPSCKQCNMVFRRIMGLINHWRTGVPHVKDRNGVKLLGCDICDSFNIINGFRDKEEVAEHTKAVHGEDVLIDSSNLEKPLCPICQRGFTYRKGVIEHIQILHGEHFVYLIGARTPELKQKVLDELQYRCHVCPKTFRVKKSLLQHLEKFHQDTSGYTQPRPGSPQSNFKAHSVKGDEEISKWTSPRKSTRTSAILPKTEESSEDSNSRQSFGEGNDGGGRGTRRSLGVGERERRSSIQQESRPKRKSTGGIAIGGDRNATRAIVGGGSLGGGRTRRDSSGEDTGANRRSRARLGRTDLRNGGGGGGLDGEVEDTVDDNKDLNSPETCTKPSTLSIKEEKILPSVQESIKDYQTHLEQVKKANQERLKAQKEEEERKQARKAEAAAKKRAKKLEIQERKRAKKLEAENRKLALKLESESNDTTLDNSVSEEPKNPTDDLKQEDDIKESVGIEMDCEVKDEIYDPMEVGEESKDNLDESNYISDEFSKESSDTEVIINSEKCTKDNDDITDSNKDSKSSSDQENIKLDQLKKKRRGKFRLTTKTNKSKKFAVVQSDSYIKTLNKAITDNAETSKPNEESKPDNEEEQSLVLRKTERERPLSKRLLQQKLLKTKLKEIGKKLLNECGKNEIQQTLDLRRLTRTSSQDSQEKDKIINKCEEASNEDNCNKEDKENRSEDTNETTKPSETPDEPDELLEECLYKDECSRKFCSYFSMMRHVAFFHRPERTAELMKLKLKK